jgi:hypothetical protein
MNENPALFKEEMKGLSPKEYIRMRSLTQRELKDKKRNEIGSRRMSRRTLLPLIFRIFKADLRANGIG